MSEFVPTTPLASVALPSRSLVPECSASRDEFVQRPRMARSRYIVGIDLGTTNCAVAYVDTKGRERPTADIRPFEVPQLVAPGETAPRPMLPSFLYLPGTHELPPGRAALPWRGDADRIVGEFARIQGARVPGHLVAAAKSWLCHPGVDREADDPPLGLARARRGRSRRSRRRPTISPHIRDAWNVHGSPREDEAHRLEQQEVVLTVPASFDEAARELTRRGREAGGDRSRSLLEEPQAAFYCWIVIAPGRLAARGPRGRADPGLRHRRRHDRLQPDHRRRDARPGRASAAWPWATT